MRKRPEARMERPIIFTTSIKDHFYPILRKRSVDKMRSNTSKKLRHEHQIEEAPQIGERHMRFLSVLNQSLKNLRFLHQSRLQ